jgi:hypothetical protein
VRDTDMKEEQNTMLFLAFQMFHRTAVMMVE